MSKSKKIIIFTHEQKTHSEWFNNHRNIRNRTVILQKEKINAFFSTRIRILLRNNHNICISANGTQRNEKAKRFCARSNTLLESLKPISICSPVIPKNISGLFRKEGIGGDRCYIGSLIL